MNQKVPEFRSAEEERVYWAEADDVQATSSRERKAVFSRGLKVPEIAACLRLPGAMLEELRVQSHLMDVSPKSLMKTYIAERMEREMMKERFGDK